MAFVTDTHITTSTQGVIVKTAKMMGTAVLKGAKSFGTFIIGVAEANSRAHIITLLESKTDRQLADMGIKRENIVAHVFRDKMHL